MEPIRWVVLVQNGLSAFLGLITVLLVLGRGRGKLARRVSVRFTLAIASVDVMKALTVLAYCFWDITGVMRHVVHFFLMWMVLLYMFLNGMLALNLYLVFVRGCIFSERWTKYYFFGALGMATLQACIFNSSEWFGWGSERGTLGEFATTWLCLKGWILGGCCFNLIVICLALRKLSVHGCPKEVACQTHRQIRSLVVRV
ncbi:hypothetical protein DSO57_1021050 [Entomophthora muscae]|uniref:Uncharacterized protein n=2 Tax=Entomophthora muscae TaxID=34485 RepID=A0ACC2S625_9FUNG|nr:hypothetical protein DSO57_1019433 [Entomophthora muscae]KAJ9061406.1 hypothetical protein DSO57_1021050 [Entomophthora muscae]